MAEVTFERVHKIFPDGTRAVHDISLDIRDGEFVVLVGPSGCGKTTALRMLAGLEVITAGEIRIGERVVNDVPPKERDIAMVFQNYALYPHLTVGDNIGFGLKLRKLPKKEIERRVGEAAGILGISELLDRKPRALSGGQRQRVAMGRAIVREPQAFLMDEPLSNLDAKLRVQMRAEVLRLQRDLGTTTIYVTHDQTEALTMGDRVAVLRRGMLQQVDQPQTLYDRPVNLFVAGFIGSPAMNLVEAELQVHDGAMFAVFGDQRVRVDEQVIHQRPALRRWVGRPLILGIRPEDMEDAAVARDHPPQQRLKAILDLTEELGSEVYVHFRMNARGIPPDESQAAGNEVATGAPEQFERTGTPPTPAGLRPGARATRDASEFVARFSPRTRARSGDSVEIVVDTARLHFFDPDTSMSIFD